MFCGNCGASMSDSEQFCTKCGAPREGSAPSGYQQPAGVPPYQQPTGAPPYQQPAGVPPYQQPAAAPKAPKAPGGKGGLLPGILIGAAVVAAAAAVLVFTGVLRLGGGDHVKHEGPGYDSPEEAVEAYVDTLRAADLDAMTATFALETWAEHADFEAYLDWVQAYCPAASQRLPGGDPCRERLSVAQEEGFLANQFFYQYMTLFHPDIDISTPIYGGDFDAGAFAGKLGAPDAQEVLGSIQMGKFVRPDWFNSKYLDEHIQDTLEQLRTSNGADELADLCLELEIDGEDYYLFMMAVCYDGKWYNAEVGGTLADLAGVPYYRGGLAPRDEIGVIPGERGAVWGADR